LDLLTTFASADSEIYTMLTNNTGLGKQLRQDSVDMVDLLVQALVDQTQESRREFDLDNWHFGPVEPPAEEPKTRVKLNR